MKRHLLVAQRRSVCFTIALAVGFMFGFSTGVDLRAEDQTALKTTGEKPAKKAAGTKHFYNSYVGKRPPELTGATEHWVNQTSQVTLEKLHGRVVWLEFNF